jgi:phosphoglycerate dehydrogenase-like enzyme
MRIAVLDDYLRRARELADWDSLGADVEPTFFHQPIEPELLAETLSEFEALVVMRERTSFPRALLERLPKLELLVTTGMRNAAVDIAYLNERGVVVCGTESPSALPGPGVPSTVEVAWALIFAVLKRVTIEDRALRAGSWQVGMPVNLAGSTLALAGLGRLGAAMVAPARTFGMEVIAWSQNLTDDRAGELGVDRVGKSELLARADVLSIHLVLSARTRGLIGAAELAQMRPTAVLVNTSRGPIVDAAALLDALLAGTIAAAGLDVFDREPLPADDPLLRLDNVVLLPHLGYVNEPTFRAMYAEAIEDIAAYLAGDPIRLLG